MSSKILTVSDTSYEADLLQSQGLVLVDFWAPWCGPCKALAPLLDEIANDYDGEVRVAKVDADQNKESMERFSVRGLPTLILLKNGAECERLVGISTKTRLANLLDKHLEA